MRVPAARAGLLALAGVLAAGPALAGEVEARFSLAGEDYRIERGEESFERQLYHGDRLLYAAPFLDHVASFELAGTHVAAIEASSGGNACPGHPVLLLARAEGGAEKVIELPDECAGYRIEKAGEGLEIRYLPEIGLETPLYHWTPETGLAFQRMLAFSPEPGTGWADIAEATPEHPGAVFANEALYLAIRARVGRHAFADFAHALGVAPPAVREGDLVLLRGCWPHRCDEAGGLMVLDLGRRLVYAAMNDFGEARAWPEPATDWPAPVRDMLARHYR